MRTKSILSIAATLTIAAQTSFAGDVSYGGFISNGYIKSSANDYLADSEKGDWDFAEIGLNANWSPMERTTIRGQIFTFELGPYGNFDPLVDYLFIDYNVNPAFGFRLGRVKRAEGIYTDIQDIDVARTSILIPTGMYDARYRDFSASVDGASIYGNFQAGDHSFEYTVYHGNIDLATDSGVAAYALTGIGSNLVNAEIPKIDAENNSGAQIWWYTPVSGLRLGASYSYYDGFTIDVTGNLPFVGYPVLVETIAEVDQTRLSLEYFIGDWTIVSEYNVQVLESVARNTIAGNPMPWTSSNSEVESWYVSASRRFLEKFEGGITYSKYYGDKDDRTSPSRIQHDTQFSVRYDATANWSIKAELHLMEGTNRLFTHVGQNSGALDANWNLFAMKSTFSF